MRKGNLFFSLYEHLITHLHRQGTNETIQKLRRLFRIDYVPNPKQK